MSTGAPGATVERQARPSQAAEPTPAQVRQHLARYLANELAAADQAGVAAHLRHCPACATALMTFLQELRATTALLGSLPRHPAPWALRERLLAIPDRAAGREPGERGARVGRGAGTGGPSRK